MARLNASETQIAERKRRIIDAALSIYRQDGIEAVTLRAVAAEAGISHFTPYRYFKSKDALVTAIRVKIWREFAAHLAQSDDAALRPIQRLRGIYYATIDFALNYPEDYRLIFSLRQPAITDDPELHQARLQAVQFVEQICEQAISAGEVLHHSAIAWLNLMWSAVHGLLSLHLANLLVMGPKLQDLTGPMLEMLTTPSPGTIARTPEND